MTNKEFYSNMQQEKQKQVNKQKQFVNKLEDYFDIAHLDNLKLIKIVDVDCKYLPQRKNCKKDYMLGLDKKL